MAKRCICGWNLLGKKPTAGCSYEGTLGKGGTSRLWKMVEGEGILKPRMPSPYLLNSEDCSQLMKHMRA